MKSAEGRQMEKMLKSSHSTKLCISPVNGAFEMATVARGNGGKNGS